MQDSFDPDWLQWARQLQAIAQNGLAYAESHYDIERYKQVREVAAEMMAAGAGIGTQRVLDLFSQEVGYATPKIDSRGVVFRDDALLLVRELADGGRWTLPGGWADPNESPAEAVVREVWEETGYETRATRLLAVYDRSKHPHVPPHPHYVYKLFFECELVGGVATLSHETGESAFFPRHGDPRAFDQSRDTRPDFTAF